MRTVLGCDGLDPRWWRDDGECPARQGARVEPRGHEGSRHLPRSAPFTGHASRSTATARDRPAEGTDGTAAGDEAEGGQLAPSDRDNRLLLLPISTRPSWPHPTAALKHAPCSLL
jgi:hypothetical protein